jgi:hypothetical protein
MLRSQPVRDEASCRPLSSIVRMTLSPNVICSTNTSCRIQAGGGQAPVDELRATLAIEGGVVNREFVRHGGLL